MSGIVSWGVYIPRYRIKTEEIARVWGQDPRQISSGLKITQKSVPSIDEDTATIAVEAAKRALLGLKVDIGALYIGSESHPYAVKPTGTIVGQALGIGEDFTTADFEFACKAGTAAIQACLGLVNSGMVQYALAGAADTAQAKPGDILEYTAAAGGAVFLIGKKDVAATINKTVSFTTDTPDFWRRGKAEHPSHAGAFTGEPAYYRHVTEASKRLMKACNTKPSDYTYAVFHQPNGKFPERAGKRLGFTEEQIRPGIVVDMIGNTYSASSLIGLAMVLDIAKPGDRILLTSYGSGAGSDSFDMTVTDRITRLQSGQKHDEVVEYIDYPKYMINKGMI